MKTYFFGINFLIMLLFSFNVNSQSIEIKIKKTLSHQAKLFYLSNEEEELIDSCKKDSTDKFIFNLKNNFRKGFYKFKIGKNINFNFIVGNDKEIILETVIFAAEDSLKSIQSTENDLYIRYQKLKKRESQLTWLLSSARDYYKLNSEFGKSIDIELHKIKKEFLDSATFLANQYKNLLMAKVIKLELQPLPQQPLNQDENRKFLLENWWRNSDLTDSSLLSFSELNKKLWGYFDLIFNEKLDKEEQEIAFIDGANTVLNMEADPKIKSFFRKSIYDEFIETDYLNVANYVVNTQFHNLESIESDEVDNETGKVFNVGEFVFDFKVVNKEKGKIKISDIQSKYKLLVFWSSWCPHCIEMLPELKLIYNKFKDKGFEIIAISVDDEVENCNSVITEKNLNWINDNINNLSSNKVKTEYNAVETPKFFLVDQELKIVSLPSNVKQLDIKLQKLFK